MPGSCGRVTDMGRKESMETSRSIEVVGIGIPYYDMVINVN